eukprot:CAMPEP_0115076778 /NCGR_PEP_ID=MMETSP0227-20121206/16621_1 /TAXON_ID=89957 /ORGANISM="Polarella glacialis, Strain CCMP 1383" /LENGTH=183 /DNA_ID=CAMNT_0002463967 /DNA_START=599 /DNA_END=1151 /DNA_ORIENTATION=+
MSLAASLTLGAKSAFMSTCQRCPCSVQVYHSYSAEHSHVELTCLCTSKPKKLKLTSIQPFHPATCRKARKPTSPPKKGRSVESNFSTCCYAQACNLCDDDNNSNDDDDHNNSTNDNNNNDNNNKNNNNLTARAGVPPPKEKCKRSSSSQTPWSKFESALVRLPGSPRAAGKAKADQDVSCYLD